MDESQAQSCLTGNEFKRNKHSRSTKKCTFPSFAAITTIRKTSLGRGNAVGRMGSCFRRCGVRLQQDNQAKPPEARLPGAFSQSGVRMSRGWTRSSASASNSHQIKFQGSSSKALSNFAPRELLSITQAKFLCKRLFRVLLKSFLREANDRNQSSEDCNAEVGTSFRRFAGSS